MDIRIGFGNPGEVEALIADLDRVAARVPDAEEQIKLALARMIKERAVANLEGAAPDWPVLSFATERKKGQKKPLSDTGDLRRSIEVWTEGDSAMVGVRPGRGRADGKDADKVASYVEFGVTVRATSAARAFFAGRGVDISEKADIVVVPPRPFLGPAADEVEADADAVVGEFLDDLFGSLGPLEPA